jgi:hypothetical protein
MPYTRPSEPGAKRSAWPESLNQVDETDDQASRSPATLSSLAIREKYSQQTTAMPPTSAVNNREIPHTEMTGYGRKLLLGLVSVKPTLEKI